MLSSLPLTCRLILVGDVNQLPSVGPGNVLSDLLTSENHSQCQVDPDFSAGHGKPHRAQCAQDQSGRISQRGTGSDPTKQGFLVDYSRMIRLEFRTWCGNACANAFRLPTDLTPCAMCRCLPPMHKGDCWYTGAQSDVAERSESRPTRTEQGKPNVFGKATVCCNFAMTTTRTFFQWRHGMGRGN